MDFLNLEKSAIINVLKDIMIADGEIDQSEKEYFFQIGNVLKITKAETDAALAMNVTKSLTILNRMNDAKKHMLALMMSEMIKADDNITVEEMEIFVAVFASIGIPLPENM